jgi:RraA family protein
MKQGILINPRVSPDSAAIAAFRGLPSSVIGDVMGRMPGSVGLAPVNRSPVEMVGNAVTVRVRAGDNLLIHKALTMLEAGDVLLVDSEGDISRALVGELMMTSAKRRGCVGFVMDGAIRDVDAFESAKFPCYARGVTPRGPYKEGPGSINVPVVIGGMVVNPGDIIVGDSDGIVAIPAADAARIAKAALEKLETEKKTLAEINSGTYSTAWIDQALGIRP